MAPASAGVLSVAYNAADGTFGTVAAAANGGSDFNGVTRLVVTGSGTLKQADLQFMKDNLTNAAGWR